MTKEQEATLAELRKAATFIQQHGPAAEAAYKADHDPATMRPAERAMK